MDSNRIKEARKLLRMFSETFEDLHTIDVLADLLEESGGWKGEVLRRGIEIAYKECPNIISRKWKIRVLVSRLFDCPLCCISKRVDDNCMVCEGTTLWI